MKVVIQRVSEASVTIDGQIHGEIKKGFLLLVGIQDADNEEIIRKMADKIYRMRIFEDENGKMNLSLKDINGELLIVSQFTLYADCTGGNRPSFTLAAKPDKANELYECFIKQCKKENVKVEHGIFGSDMKVELLNDGPVTIILEK